MTYPFRGPLNYLETEPENLQQETHYISIPPFEITFLLSDDALEDFEDVINYIVTPKVWTVKTDI